MWTNLTMRPSSVPVNVIIGTVDICGHVWLRPAAGPGLYTTTEVRLMLPSISRVVICFRGEKRCLKLCVFIPLATIRKAWFSQQKTN